MANALREILARFGVEVNTKPLDEGNKKVEGLIDKLGGLQQILESAFVLKGVQSFVKNIFDEGNALQETARRAGMSVEAYQALEFAGEQLNVSTEKLGVGFKYLQRNLALAAGGNKQLGDTFDKLGISIEEGVPIDTEEAFLKVADSIAAIGDANMQTYYAMKVFGRGGYTLLSMLKEGSGTIKEYYAKVKELGGGFSNEMGKSVDALDDLWNEQRMSLRSVRAAILEVMLPSLEMLSQGVIKLNQEFVNWNSTGQAARVTYIGMIAGVAKALFPFLTKLMGMSKQFAGFFLLALWLEDIYVWLKGGRSMMGLFFGDYEKAIAKSNKLTGEYMDIMLSSWDGFWNGVVSGAAHVGAVILMLFDKMLTEYEKMAYSAAQVMGEAVSTVASGLGLDTVAEEANKGIQKLEDRKSRADRRHDRLQLNVVESVEKSPYQQYMDKQLAERRTKRKELQAGEDLAEAYGGKPEDYTTESIQSKKGLTPGVRKWLLEESQKSPMASFEAINKANTAFRTSPDTEGLNKLLAQLQYRPQQQAGAGQVAVTQKNVKAEIKSEVVVNAKDFTAQKAAEIGKGVVTGMKAKLAEFEDEGFDSAE